MDDSRKNATKSVEQLSTKLADIQRKIDGKIPLGQPFKIKLTTKLNFGFSFGKIIFRIKKPYKILKKFRPGCA